MADVEQLYDYQQALEALRKNKASTLEQYNELIYKLAKDKAIIRELLRLNLKEAMENTKKNSGMELLELYVASAYGDIELDSNRKIKTDPPRTL